MRLRALFLLMLACVMSAQTKKVIANLSPDVLKEVTASAPNVKIVAARGADLAKEIVDADAVIGIGVPPALFQQAKQLKWIHVASAGVENALFPALIDSPVVVTNMKPITHSRFCCP
jgi:phosphoglycerate dehydrogenase-like enzyme